MSLCIFYIIIYISLCYGAEIIYIKIINYFDKSNLIHFFRRNAKNVLISAYHMYVFPLIFYEQNGLPVN